MKVGILSMQKVMNYGSFLQAFALKKTIEWLGHDCEFIDIEQGTVFPELKRTYGFILKKAIERYLKWNILPRMRYTHCFQRRFKTVFFDLLGVDTHTFKHFDLVVIGSDEVFNFAQRVPWGYTPQLYGRVTNADKVISYAASFGHTTMKDIEHYGVKQEISDALCSMKMISVRDKNSYEIIEKLTGRTPLIHVDPVLIFDYEPFIKLPELHDYVVVYTYPNRIKSKDEIEAIRTFARKHSKKLLSVGFYFPWCDETIVPDPFEVLGYIKNADYVVTDTFHGSVMSLKFNRPFVSLVRNTNKEKMTSLLSQFGLGNRILNSVDHLEQTMVQAIDYDSVNDILEVEKKHSLEYLKRYL